MQSFIFGKGTPWTYEQLQSKRKIAEQLASQIGTPRNVGEGLSAIGKALAARGINKKADARDAELKGQFDQKWSGLLGGGSAQPSSSYAPVDPNSPQAIGDDTMAALGQPSNNIADVIKGFEGYKSEPYWDVNAFRAGYGSDTVTLPDGTVQPVKPGMAVDRAAAERDLNRRIEQEFKPKVVSVMGPERFSALSPEQQGALVSIAYNYGSLPTPVARAAETGDAGRIADAIQGLIGHNGGINAKRRAAEAAAFGQSAPGGMNIQTLAELAGSPYATDAQKAVVQALMSQQMQAADPRNALELQLLRKQVDEFGKPKPAQPTDDMREYDLAKSQGFTGTLQDWIIGQRKAGAASNTVTVGGQPSNIGTIPQGYAAIPDETQPSGYRMVAIPGGPEDTSASTAAAESNALTASDVVTTAAQRARDAAANRNFGSAGTTFVAGLPIIGDQTDSGEVVRQVDVLKSQAAAGNLQAMRDASKTGGALGNVTEKELKLLQDKSGTLNPNSPNFLRDLDDYERTLLRIVHGNEAGDRIFEETRKDADGWQTINGVKIRVKK